jgi:putative spermidine/putrescine transport system permease protein
MRRPRPGALGRSALTGIGWLGFAFLLAPLFVVIAVSVSDTAYLKFPPQGFTLKWYRQFIGDESYREAFLLSAELAALATLLALGLGVPAGLVIARKRFPGRAAASSLFLSPLILPTIVLGVALLQYASALGFARSFGALLLGHVIIVLPYVMRTTLASLSGFDLGLEEAAQDLGATPAATFFLVTLPQIKPGIIAGSLFAFIMSWINVEVSIFHTRAGLMTLPVKLFNYVQFNVDPLLAAVSAVTIYLALAAVLLLDLAIGIEKAASGA